jgi:hypothetical protein
MKKVVDYSVLVASGLLIADGAMKGFKAVMGKDYKSLIFIGLGVAVAGYAFSYALDSVKANSVVAKEVVVIPVAPVTEGE